MSAHRCLVIGGARSGKSRWAEQRLGVEPVRYLATGYTVGADPEWNDRIADHRRRRPASWTTLEHLDLAGELRKPDRRPLLVDCLTLWLTRTIDELGAWSGPTGEVAARTDEVLNALARSPGECVLVTNEVGCGVVPATESGRRFADLLGRLNAEVAAVCDEVVLMVAGIPVPIKGGAPSWRIR